MLVLHQMQMSGNCYKVRLTARQLAIPIALKEYPLLGSETRKPAFLSLNPNGRVPLLELDDGRCLSESNAIIYYLAQPSPLMPQNHWDLGKTLQWMFFEQYSHEPYIAVARFWLTYAPKEDRQARQHLLGEWHARGNAALAVMEEHLRAHDWFAGKHYSVADIALYGYTHCAREGGFELSNYPAVSRWLDRVQNEPGHITLDEVW